MKIQIFLLKYQNQGEKDELLMQIQELAFAMNDIALYLDVKEDNNMINTFNNYSKKKEELCKHCSFIE